MQFHLYKMPRMGKSTGTKSRPAVVRGWVNGLVYGGIQISHHFFIPVHFLYQLKKGQYFPKESDSNKGVFFNPDIKSY